MKRKIYAILTFSLFSLSTAYPQIPRTISYQGFIADQSGTPVPDGIHALSISVYLTQTGGSPLYTEVASVNLSRGIFTIVLGATGGIPDSLIFDRPYFLGISIDGGSELQPRTAFTTAPYAFHAIVAEEARTIAASAPNVVRSVNGQSGTLTINGSGGPSVIVSDNSLTIHLDSAGGDLKGIYPNPTIADGAVAGNKIADQGVALNKISRTGADAGEVLGYDGSFVNWRKDGLTLPYSAITKSPQSAIEIIDSASFSSTGSGPLLRLDMRDTATTRQALRITHKSHGIAAIDASTEGGGSVAVFSKSKDRATGGGGTFIGPVLMAESRTGSQVTAAEFNALDTGNTRPAVDIQHRGKGVGLQVDATGANIATFRRRRVFVGGSSSTSSVVRFDSTGKGFFDGGTQTGGADIAEAFDVVGEAGQYEKGDVLVLSRDRARQVMISSKPYSTLVAGVYATKPGVLLTEHSIDNELSGMIPMGVIGVIPTKVTTENGPIRIGDLLVTSSLPGHAMRGNTRTIRKYPGCVIGKALENFDADTGFIKVLVSIR